jgi:2-aminoethylphosphonate-pyruvate transaminase
MSAYRGPDGQEDMPYLLTPGPVTTSRDVKFAMLADYNARDSEFADVTRFVRTELKRIAGCNDSHECVLLQGSGTSAVEAAVGTLCPARRKKTLVICNGADGERAASMMERIGRPFVRLTYRETTMPRASDVAKTLDEDRSISHVWLAHIETSTGMLNPMQDIAQVVKSKGRIMMLDATASFGGLPINVVESDIDVLVSTTDVCLENVPGIAFVITRRDLLESAVNQCHSPTLDLHEQWQAMQASGLFRFTPPTHVVVALREALRGLQTEGGVDGRSKRYLRNADTLRVRLKALGLTLLLEDAYASPIVHTVLAPRAATFDFGRFYIALRDRGFAIAPGVITTRQSFRIACVGNLDEKVIQHLVVAIEEVLNMMDVRSLAPGDA